MPSSLSGLHPPPIQMCRESMKNGEISFSSKPLTRRAGSHEAALSAVSLLRSQTPQPTPVSTDAAIIFSLSSARYNMLHANVLHSPVPPCRRSPLRKCHFFLHPSHLSSAWWVHSDRYSDSYPSGSFKLFEHVQTLRIKRQQANWQMHKTSTQTFSLVCFFLIFVTWGLKLVDISLFLHRWSLLLWYFISEESCPLKQGSGVGQVTWKK